MRPENTPNRYREIEAKVRASQLPVEPIFKPGEVLMSADEIFRRADRRLNPRLNFEYTFDSMEVDENPENDRRNSNIR